MIEFKNSGEFATTWVGGLGLIQGEEIVRCKDCKYFGYLGDDMCYLPNGDGGFAGWKVDPEGFCAWGEREVMEWSGKTASTS